jgi:hypothetical protein
MTGNANAYERWKARRAAIDCPHDFAEQVMRKVYRDIGTQAESPLRCAAMLARISRHPLARVGLVAAGGVLGFLRLAAMTQFLLGSGSV